jgi:hypothetical protein
MSSKGERHYRLSLRQSILAIVGLCASVWWAPARALAQDAPPSGLTVTGHTASWSLEEPALKKSPYLVVGMADRWNTPHYSSILKAGDKPTNSSVGDTSTHRVGPAFSVNRATDFDSDPMVLSSLTDLGVQSINARQTIERSRHLTESKAYSLLYDRAAPGSFLYGYPANYPPAREWVAANESFTHEIAQAPNPLLQLELGGWRLPVMLSKAPVSQ